MQVRTVCRGQRRFLRGYMNRDSQDMAQVVTETLHRMSIRFGTISRTGTNGAINEQQSITNNHRPIERQQQEKAQRDEVNARAWHQILNKYPLRDTQANYNLLLGWANPLSLEAFEALLRVDPKSLVMISERTDHRRHSGTQPRRPEHAAPVANEAGNVQLDPATPEAPRHRLQV